MGGYSRTEIVSFLLLCAVVALGLWTWLQPEDRDIATVRERRTNAAQQSGIRAADRSTQTGNTLVEQPAVPVEAVEKVKRFSKAILEAEPSLDPQDAFSELDRDSNKTLSEAEFAVHYLAEEQRTRRPSEVVIAVDGLARARAKFSRDDEDHDGELSEAEFSAGKFRIDPPEARTEQAH